MSKTIRILTYNIHKGFGIASFLFVLHKIRDAIEKTDVDLIFLQETQGAHAKHAINVGNWPSQSQCEFIAENNWKHCVYGKNALYRHGHHGNGIISKFPFTEWENISVSKHKRASRSLLHAVIKIPRIKTRVHVVCIHFALFKTEREKQLTTLCTRILEHVPFDEPLIIAGDFNDWRGHAERFLETELGLKEAFKVKNGNHAKTFPAWSPKLAVDRIYFRNINLIDCQRLKGKPWQSLSDHLPLYAEFLL
jgi:endonuclease/exonuclease/phosphatase family metal-dependent hydrolase